MIDFILNTLVYTFAIYGIVEIIRKIIYVMEYTNLTENRDIHNYSCKKSREKNRRYTSLNII